LAQNGFVPKMCREPGLGVSVSAVVNIAIVGSGPGGISAAAHAAKAGISHLLLERTDHLSDTIYKYQRGKYVMATPDILPLRSDASFGAGRRETVLETWDRQTAELGVSVRFNADVTSIKKTDGVFSLGLANGERIAAEKVILAIGLQGNINKLTCPGAESAMVQYQLDDPNAYEGETIVVIGAGDAAIENAVALARQNTVIVVNRRDEFARAKQGNLTLILNAIERRDIQCYYNSAPARVEDRAIVLETAEGEARVPCDRIIARLGASAPRRFVESCGISFPARIRPRCPRSARPMNRTYPAFTSSARLAAIH
jgi:thioredoxin reductase